MTAETRSTQVSACGAKRTLRNGFGQDNGRRRETRDQVGTQPAIGLVRWIVRAVGWHCATLLLSVVQLPNR